MAFQPGNRANPGGKPKDKAFADAVRVAINREAGDGRKKLMLLADKLIDFAMAGEGWAMQQIADRLDGKPAQSVELSGGLHLSHEDALNELDGPGTDDQAPAS